MKISSVNIKNSIDGLKNISMNNLSDLVVITGANGAGKSRLLKLIERSILEKENLDDICIDIQDGNNTYAYNKNTTLDISVVNYSHYDDVFQSPTEFTPYVICQAQKKLEACNFEETSQNGLLFIEYISKYTKSTTDLQEFNKLVKLLLNTEIQLDEQLNPKLFGFDIYNAKLSPGQQYLLRMCIALYCNKISNKNFVLFLDEPETHLHPNAVIKLIDQVRHIFNGIQIWISTHSIALLSVLDVSDIWHIENGTCKKLGSRSEPLMKSLVGNEKQRFQLQQFVVWPENFACNQFAAECLKRPQSVNYKKGDKQISMVINELLTRLNDKKLTVIDYGAGKGRLIEGIGLEAKDILNKINYFAYDISPDDSTTCKEYMHSYSINVENYFNDIDKLQVQVQAVGNADLIFLVNVLHEIEPKYWESVFKDIYNLLSPNGYLVLIEHSQLTIGEKPYKSGFVVVQHEAMKLLSNSHSCVLCEHHPANKTISRYLVPREAVKNWDNSKTFEMLKCLKELSIEKVYQIKQKDNHSFELGIELAFWVHQLANIEVIFSKDEIKKG